MTLTATQILEAQSWRQLGIGRSHTDLQALRKRWHPDVNPAPNANEVFAKIEWLYDNADYLLRVAEGKKTATNEIEWVARAGFRDLAARYVTVVDDLGTTESRWFPTVLASRDGKVRVNYGFGGHPQRWFWLSDFPRLDQRTTVWLAKRLFAALAAVERSGWCHTDIIPNVVAIDPDNHGLKLDGWWSAVRIGEPLDISPTQKVDAAYEGGKPADSALMVEQAARALLERCHPMKAMRAVLEQAAHSPRSIQQTFWDLDRCGKEAFGTAFWALDAPTIEPI
jgi:hypothetical protein